MQAPNTTFNMPNDFHEHNSSLMQDFNPFLFTEVPGLDPFDTNFDLDGIDAYLEGYLDPAFPTNLQ
jgi:hypothetical protein